MGGGKGGEPGQRQSRTDPPAGHYDSDRSYYSVLCGLSISISTFIFYFCFYSFLK
jgi:hypothetical protein